MRHAERLAKSHLEKERAALEAQIHAVMQREDLDERQKVAMIKRLRSESALKQHQIMNSAKVAESARAHSQTRSSRFTIFALYWLRVRVCLSRP